jgi:Na+-transporting methylmalonyl-CoA/oxaloacetate decarboxylase gamma subunit
MIPFPALLAISLPDNPTFADNVQFQLTGLAVVVFTLTLLAILVALVGRIFIALQKKAPPAAGPVPATGPSPAVDGAVYAAIAAAVATVLSDRRFLIRGVQSVDPRQNLAWGAEGRRSIYASRRVR